MSQERHDAENEHGERIEDPMNHDTSHTTAPALGPEATSAPASGAACSCGAHVGDEMLTLAEVAELLRVPVATLRYWRHLGSGPRSFRIGRFVRYWRSEVVAWLDRQTLQGRGR